MTIPRQVLPGCDYMITRRCSERRFFLRPDHETNNAFIYCLALAAARAKVEILFVVALSNHYHAGVHDPDGNFPVFCEHFHALFARCQNVHLGRVESFWSSEPTSVVRLVESRDTLAKMVYAYANPCAADLVDTCDAWPGVNSIHAALSTRSLTAKRPEFFFRATGDQPEVVNLAICRPRGFANQTEDEWRALLLEQIRAAEAEHRERRRATGKTVLGLRAILSQNPFDSPQGAEKRSSVRPRIAAKSKWLRIEALGRSKAFVEAYRSAIESWMTGIATVVFPFGTYWMRKFAHVLCDCDEGATLATSGAACLSS